MAQLRFLDVSLPRQTLIRHCQQVNFGKIVHLMVRGGEPVITPDTEFLIDMKLDGDVLCRPEGNLSDFALSAEILRLLSELDAMGDGVVEHIEVRAGIPRRIVFKRTQR